MAAQVPPPIPGQGEQPELCYLGAIAPELLDLILLETDSVRDLANFITTASFVYRRFDQRKRPIIWRVLQNELGPVLADARFLGLFPYIEPGRPGVWETYWDQIHNAAALYSDILAEGASAVDSRPPRHAVPSLAELTQLCRTLHPFSFLTRTYTAAQLRSLEDAGGGLAAAPPSRPERLRVLRAFIRRQIISNAWAPNAREDNFIEEDVAAISNTSDHQGVRLGLLGALEPWELQQVDHADDFTKQLCAALCLASVREQQQQRQQSGQQPAEPAQALSKAELGGICSRADHLVRYIRTNPSVSGPALLALPRLLQSGSQDLLDAVAPAYGAWLRRYSLLPLRSAWQSLCSETLPDPARQQRELDCRNGGGGALVDFVGDAVDLPPFGWVDALGGRYLNWFGEALCCYMAVLEDGETQHALYHSLGLWRGAGFALWDRRRVEAMKELDSLRVLQTGWAVK